MSILRQWSVQTSAVTVHHLLEPGAGTFWSSELNRYYVAAPGYDDEQAAILVFDQRPKSL
jgi:hypothetical protein